MRSELGEKRVKAYLSREVKWQKQQKDKTETDNRKMLSLW